MNEFGNNPNHLAQPWFYIQFGDGSGMPSPQEFDQHRDFFLRKFQLYRTTFNSPGVAANVLAQFNVLPATGESKFKVQVNPGYAVDGLGRDIILSTAQEVELPTQKLAPSEDTLFIYVTQDHRKASQDESRPHLVEEYCRVHVETGPLPLSEAVEIGRVRISGSGRIRVAANPADPRTMEIDRRYVQFISPFPDMCTAEERASVLVQIVALQTALRTEMKNLISDREKFVLMDLRQTLTTAEILIQQSFLTRSDLFQLAHTIEVYELRTIEEMGKLGEDNARLPDVMNEFQRIDAAHENLSTAFSLERFSDRQKAFLAMIEDLLAMRGETTTPIEVVEEEEKENQEETEMQTEPVVPENLAGWHSRIRKGNIDYQLVRSLSVFKEQRPDNKNSHRVAFSPDFIATNPVRCELHWPDTNERVAEPIFYWRFGSIDMRLDTITPGQQTLVLAAMDPGNGLPEIQIRINRESELVWTLPQHAPRDEWYIAELSIPADLATESQLMIELSYADSVAPQKRTANFGRIAVYQEI